jgi:prepilin-type N-terminal cleavage/methylation domain-containing protein
MEWRGKQQGMSLIELLVALAILGVALVPMLAVFTHALKTTEHSNRRTIAENLVRDLQEEIRSKAFSEPNPTDYLPALVGTDYYPNWTTPQSTGCEECNSSKSGTKGAGVPFSTTDTRLKKFNDVDDYDGWCEGSGCTTGGCTASAIAWGLCGTNVNPAIEAYDGTPYTGKGYPHYQGFTRMVQVFNIFPNVSATKGREPRSHNMWLGVGTYRKASPFNFYDLRDERGFKNLTSDRRWGRARGKTDLKIVQVTVTYQGGFTPNFTIEDRALVAAPLSD